MKVFLFRHAERENSGSSNPPLSVRGLQQAEKIWQAVESSHWPRPSRIFSSPRLRAQQTFQILQENLDLNLQIHPDLDERHNFESAASFSRRVQHFLSLVEASSGVSFLVTHLDWLEEAMHCIDADVDLTTDRFRTWMPAQSLEFEIQDRLWIFQQLRNVPL